MVIRLVRVHLERASLGNFERCLREHIVPALHAQPGLIALHVGRRTDGNAAEFVIASIWKEVEDVQAFSGEALGDYTRTSIDHYQRI